MKNRIWLKYFALGLLLIVSGCTGALTCTSTVPNASYTGAYKGVDNNLSSEDFSRDIACANRFKNTKYPSGFVTIYGSSRITEKSNLSEPLLAKANDKLYAEIMAFAESWTRKHGKKYPIMTGAGPGMMEAGSRGAKKGGGPSIGYTTYYDPAPRGDAAEAFWKYNGSEDIIDDGLIFSSVAIREYAMILHSSAIIVAPGGTGTEWELFQILESTKSAQLKPVPIYLVGSKEPHWQSFYSRLDDMVRRGTIKPDEVAKHFSHIDRATDLLPLLENKLSFKQSISGTQQISHQRTRLNRRVPEL